MQYFTAGRAVNYTPVFNTDICTQGPQAACSSPRMPATAGDMQTAAGIIIRDQISMQTDGHRSRHQATGGSVKNCFIDRYSRIVKMEGVTASDSGHHFTLNFTHD